MSAFNRQAAEVLYRRLHAVYLHRFNKHADSHQGIFASAFFAWLAERNLPDRDPFPDNTVDWWWAKALKKRKPQKYKTHPTNTRAGSLALWISDKRRVKRLAAMERKP